MPQNPLRGMPRSYASVLLLDATTGRMLAILEGGWLMAMRAGAVSGLATGLLEQQECIFVRPGVGGVACAQSEPHPIARVCSLVGGN